MHRFWRKLDGPEHFSTLYAAPETDSAFEAHRSTIRQQQRQTEKTSMPYFVYYVEQSVTNERKQLEHLETFDNFKQARTLAREKRAELKESGSARDCRMIFAKNQTEAEKLLSAPREERVVGED
jgi:hypothetical protein